MDWTAFEPHAIYGALAGATIAIFLVAYLLFKKEICPRCVILWLFILGMIFVGIATDLFAHEFAH